MALLAKEALGRDNVELVHIDWGIYEYESIRKIVKEFASEYGFKLTILDGSGKQKNVWRYGPSCNACTKYVKLKLIKDYVRNRIIMTGANSYDSWGKSNIKVFNGVYAPLLELSKKEIRAILDFMGIKIKKIGESSEREGCKLKHLLKMLISEEFHGRAVSLSNEILLEYLKENKIKTEKASVKIIGPLRENIAVVVVKPTLSEEHMEKIEKILKDIPEISKVIFPKEKMEITVVASPPIYKNEETQRNVMKVIDIPGKYKWILSKNKKLRTFQVVNVSF